MRFMMIMKSNADTEAGRMPSEAELSAMGTLNEEMVAKGVMLAGEGLHPSSKGARVHFAESEDDDAEPTVLDGPFAETKELIGGFWIIEAASLEEAVGWARRVPSGGHETNIEIRQVFEMEDFGEEFTPELREREAKAREQMGN